MPPKMKTRMNFSESVRKQVRSRSNEVCEYCHSQRATQYHHVFPRSRRGRGIYTNCAHLCFRCHRYLHDNPTLLNQLIEQYEQKYGKNFYKDEWDFHY